MTETKVHEERTTALPNTLDPKAAFAKALNHEVYYDRGRDVHNIMESALHYATQTMTDAIGQLAFQEKMRVSDTPTRSERGDRLCFIQGPSPQAIDLLLSTEGESGARLITVHFKPVLHAEGEAILTALNAELEAEMDELGLEGRSRLLAHIGFGAKLETNTKIADFKASGKGYRAAELGDAVASIHSSTLNMGKANRILKGPNWALKGFFDIPKELEVEETVLYSKALSVSEDGTLRVKYHPEGWWPAIDFDITPATRYPEDDGLSPRTSRSGSRFDAGLVALSHLLRDNGFGPLVAEKNAITGNTKWHTTGVGYFQDLEEAGYAAVCTSGGFFDEAVMTHIERFSADIAAQDVEKNVEEWLRTARGLQEKGFVNAESTFDCNDGRDRAYACGGPDLVYFHSETQHGQYRVSFGVGADDEILTVTAERSGVRDVGRFVMTQDGLRPDYGPSQNHVPIAHTIRNVRDMNGIIGSLCSVSCVFAEEYPAEDESPRP